MIFMMFKVIQYNYIFLDFYNEFTDIFYIAKNEPYGYQYNTKK